MNAANQSNSAPKWSDVASDEDFQAADWETRQKVRAEFYRRTIEPNTPADLRDEVQSKFFTQTESDVFGERSKSVDDASRSASYTGGLPDQRALEEQEAQEGSPGLQDAPDESPGLTSNALRNAGERGLDLAGNAMQFVGNMAEMGEKLIADNLGGLNPGVIGGESDAMRQRGYDPDVELGGYGLDFTSQANPEDTNTGLTAGGQAVEDTKLGYEPNYTIDRALDDPSAETLAGAAAEQGPAALADMAGMVINLPSYLASRTQEIGESRVKNNPDKAMRETSPGLREAGEKSSDDGTSNPDKLKGEANSLGMPSWDEYAVAGPTAAASVLLDRFALGRLLPGGKGAVSRASQIPGAVGRAGATEATTEAVQEGGIEYAGESVGTEKGWDPETAGRRAAGGAIVGGPTGGAVRAGASAVEVASARGKTGGDAETPASDPETPPQPSGSPEARQANTEAVSAAADLIRHPRSELSSSEREARDSITDGDAFKALRATAEEQGDTEAVSELDAINEDVSSELEEETLSRSRGEGGPTDAMRQNLDQTAKRFSSVMERLNGQDQVEPEDQDTPSMGLNMPGGEKSATGSDPGTPSQSAGFQMSKDAGSDQKSASVPTMMTEQMRQQLRDLGHSDKEIRKFRPQEAWDRIQEGRSTSEKVENAAKRTDTEPTPAQAEAGNYRKGRVQLEGMDIAIENPKDSTRRGTDEKGRDWESQMAHHYGDIKGTVGADGDNLDVFVGERPENGKAFVVDQVNEDGGFDEHKVMLGFDSKEEARQGYLANYEEGWQGLGEISEVGTEDLKNWMRDGDTQSPFGTRTSSREETQEAATVKGDGKTSNRQAPTSRVSVDQIETDPAEYQFRTDVNDEGVDSRLEGVERWDDMRAGSLMLHEREDGRLFAADGHHRLDLARRTGQQEVSAQILREQDGYSVADARREAAETNIADGNATASDAAKVFRNSEGNTDDIITERNLPRRSQVVRDGRDLAKLSDEAFGAVLNDVVAEKDGAAIGRSFDDPDQQLAAVDAFKNVKPQNDNQRQLLANEVRQAGFADSQGEQAGLFGDDPAESLIGERVKVMDKLRQDLARDRRLFATLNSNADKAQQAGNRIATDQNEAFQDASAQALDVLERATTTPEINQQINDAARRVNDGESVAKAARELKETLLNGNSATDERQQSPAPDSESDATAGLYERPDQQALGADDTRAESTGQPRLDGGEGEPAEPGLLGGTDLSASVREGEQRQEAAETGRGRSEAVNLKADGKPFQTRRAVQLSKRFRDTPGAVAVEVDGGWGWMVQDAAQADPAAANATAQRTEETAADRQAETPARSQRITDRNPQLAEQIREEIEVFTGEDATDRQVNIEARNAERGRPAEWMQDETADAILADAGIGQYGVANQDASIATDDAPASTALNLADPQTGRPLDGIGYRVDGIDPGTLYAGAQVPVMGSGTYVAVEPSDARDFAGNESVEVREVPVRLENPLVIRSDNEWRALAREAGWETPNPSMRSTEQTQQMVSDLQSLVRERGHDGIAVLWNDNTIYDMDEATGQLIKLLRNVFSKPQVVQFDPAEALSLESYTEQDVAAREREQQQAEQTEIDRRRQEEQRADADREADDFALSGSDRAADQANARGQNSLFSFAGESSQNADRHALSNAQARLEKGEDAETVRQETGWFKGADDQWRFEIDDSDARYLPYSDGKVGQLWTESLDRVLDHPKLFDAYPGLRDIDVMSAKGMKQNGTYNHQRREIMLNADRGAMEQFSTLMHEIQHGIQSIEGFARGGKSARFQMSPFRQHEIEQQIERLSQESADRAVQMRAQVDAGEMTRDELVTEVRRFADESGLNDLRRRLKDDEQGAIQQYLRLAGEVEARNVQSRQGMNEAERRDTPPTETQDVANSDVTVVFNGEEASSAPPPANADTQASEPPQSPRAEAIRNRLDQLKSTHPELSSVEVVQSTRELPEDVLKGMFIQGVRPMDVEGVFNPETERPMVVADNLIDESDAIRVSVHETVGHHGIRGTLGEEFEPVLEQVFQSYTKSEDGRHNIAEIKASYPHIATKAHTREGRLELAEELIAHTIESDARPKLRERVMSAIRQQLRKLFPSIEWRTSDILALGDQARRWLRRQQAEQQRRDQQSDGEQGGGQLFSLSPGSTRTIELFHSGGNITEINNRGNFGSFLFFSSDRGVHGGEKNYRVEIDPKDIISSKSLFYDESAEQLEPLVQRVQEMANVDEDAAIELIEQNTDPHELDHIEPEDASDLSFDIQSITAEAARTLGYKGVSLPDEHGTSYMIDMAGHEADMELLDGQLYSFAEQQNKLSAQDLAAQLREEYPGLTLDLMGRGQRVTVSRIVAPEREQGTGSAVMRRLNDWADASGRTLALTPSSDFGGNTKRLREFYQRFGFVENKGRHKDYEISESMYREPDRGVGELRFSIAKPSGTAGGKFSSTDSTGFSMPDEGLRNATLRKMADKMRPLKILEDAIRKTGQDIEEEADAYLAEELFHGKVEYDLRQLREQHVEPLSDGLAKAKISQAELDDYLYARHAPERNATIAERNPDDPDMQDGGSGMTNAEAAEIIDRVTESGQQAEYDRLAGIVGDMTRLRLDAIREGGLEDDAVVDEWESHWQNYIPLKGWAEDADVPPGEDGAGRPRTGKGFEINGRESRITGGRKTRAASPSSQVIVDANESLIRRRKNEVAKSLLSMVTDHPNRDLWEVFTDDNPDTQRTPTRVTDPETGEKRIEVQDRAVNMAGDHRYFKAKRAGRTYYMKIHDERLMNAMRNLGPESIGRFVQTASTITRSMSSLMTSYNPEFMLTNFSRDVQTALLNLTAEQTRDDGKIKGEKVVSQTARDIKPAMSAAWRGLNGKDGKNARQREWNQWFEEFQEDGAKTGYFDMKDLDGQAKEIQSMIRQADGTTLSHMLKARKKTTDFVENMNGAVENAVRLSAYANSRRAGVSRKQAASLAKNMTVNFNRRGEVGTTLNAAYMFANASIQGTMNFGRTMVTLKDTPDGKSPKNVWSRMNLAQKIAMGMATGSFMLGMLNRWLSEEDDDGELYYDKVPDYVKERNLMLMTGSFGGEEGDYTSIPMPYGYSIFSTLGTHAEAVVAGQESAIGAAKNLALAIAGSFSPIGFEDSDSIPNMFLKNITPTIARPAAHIGVNEDFAGRPVYKENFDFGTPEPMSSLSFGSTPEAYKDFANFLNDVSGGSEHVTGNVDVSPDVMQHLVNYYGGGAWGFVEKSADFAKRTAMGEEVERYRTPFAGRFMGSVSEHGDMQRFYERRNELGQIQNQMESLKAREKIDYRRDNQQKLRLFNRATTIEKQLREDRDRRDRVEASDRLSDEAKRNRLEMIEKQMSRRVDRFNRMYNEMEDE
ncbi:LPD38 domain-containing protein [Chromohalobacter sp. 296-RDG]|uniref:LPD38 domain-containing protein n=1 Tax=Chromohalobacter sp. 296-RDG TaxID=2994062 RepID=UPI002469B5E4|nr:LPD38 domain-containing protein [Chromohalobacter sp. 296-RDG]